MRTTTQTMFRMLVAATSALDGAWRLECRSYVDAEGQEEDCGRLNSQASNRQHHKRVKH